MTTAAPDRVQPLNEIFTRGVSAMWAATYNVDLALFNEFLLGRLSDPPVNVVVLADQRRLAVSLARVPPERAAALSAVNRRWLLRSVRPGGQAFHPKAYLAVSPAKTTLLVGSGNLSAPGLDSGREVFTTFRSGTPDGDAAIATWNDWTRRLVEQTADVALAERYADLRKRLPAPEPGAALAGAPLLHNLDEPIAAQLVAAVRAEAGGPVDDLLLTAPFYDKEASAAAELLKSLAPRRAHVYVTSTTSVNGPRLAQRLADSGADVHVYAYLPDEFVHAKLVGVTSGEDGWLLSGSANLSRAALTSRSALTGGDGNVELGVLARLSADAVRAAFLPPGAVADARDPATLAPLTFQSDPDPAPSPVRLLTATAGPDGRIALKADRQVEAGWLLDDLAGHHPLVPGDDRRATTGGPANGRLVRLCSADKEPLSNHVVVDDPAALRAALFGSERDRSDRPPELAGDDTGGPLGRGLLWLNRRLVMDVSETAASSGGGGVAAGEAGQQGDDDLWERLEREELARDARADTYSRLWRPDGTGDAIIELLEVLRDRAPAETRSPSPPGVSLLSALLARRAEPEAEPEAEPSDEPEAPRRRWKASTRTRVRALNVLRRWAAAQHDSKLTWVDPFAPAGNFAAVTGFLVDLRLRKADDPGSVELTDQDLDQVWAWWLRPMTGSGQGEGWLDGLAPDDRAAVDRVLPTWLPEAVAALTWLLVRPGTDHRARTVDAQPVIAAARAHGLVVPSDATAAFLAAVTGRPISRGDVADGLLAAEEFVDDDLWCARTAEELGLSMLRLEAPPGSPVIQVRLSVRGITDPLIDPRVPRLLAAARHYRRATGIAVFAADAGWRLAFVEGEPLTYLPAVGAGQTESDGPLDGEGVTALVAELRGLTEVFPPSTRVA